MEIKDVDGIALTSKVFASHLRVSMTPVLSFIDLDGSEIYRHLGMEDSEDTLVTPAQKSSQ